MGPRTCLEPLNAGSLFEPKHGTLSTVAVPFPIRGGRAFTG
jgi:hypothetical protein